MKLGVRGSSLLALLLVGALASTALSDDSWKKSFGEGFASKDSWKRKDAVKALSPESADQLKMLLAIAEGKPMPGCLETDWYLRDAAVDVLSGKLEGKVADELKKILKAGKPVGEAEVVALAFGRSKDEAYEDELVNALKKKESDAKLKRACAIALGNYPSKKSINALIDAFENEYKDKNFIVYVHLIEALEKATQEKDKRTPQDWKNWWSGAEPTWGQKKDEKEGDGKSGEVIHTVSRGADLTFRSRGKGAPLLVLPDSGYEQDYLETYLRGLEDTHQLLYMRLPGLNDFKNPELKPEGNLPAPTFPLDRMCDAFDDLRKALIEKKQIENKPFNFFTHGGLSGWIAMRYAKMHPDGVKRMVLCSTQPSRDRGFERSRKAMETAGKQNGDSELEHLALSMLVNSQTGKALYEASSAEEHVALWRKNFSSYFANPADLEIGRLFGPLVAKKGASGEYPKIMRIDMGCMIPDFDVNKEPELPTPVLVMAGDSSFFGSADDAADIAKHFPKSQLEIFKKCGRMPFVEDNKHFLQVMEKFLH